MKTLHLKSDEQEKLHPFRICFNRKQNFFGVELEKLGLPPSPMAEVVVLLIL